MVALVSAADEYARLWAMGLPVLAACWRKALKKRRPALNDMIAVLWCVRLSGDVREVALRGKERASLLLLLSGDISKTRCRNAEQERSLSFGVCRSGESLGV